MVRGREETSTSGRPGGRPRAKPSASNIIASMTMDELKVHCEVPDSIDLRLMEGTDESTLNGGTQWCVFYPRAFSSRIAVSRAGHSQTVSSFYLGAASSYSPKHDSHSSWLLHAEPLVPARPYVGGAFHHLYVKHRVGWTNVHVSFESTTTDHEWAPRLA